MSPKKLVNVGLDVDDTAFHGAGIDLETGEIFEFKCKADFGALRKKLENIFGDNYEIRLCYEASNFGYWLCRRLRNAGIHCDIIAPSLIPMKTGARVKTDRLDAAKLAEYYAKDLLTTVYVPDKRDEEVRDLIRSRAFLVKQNKMLKTHILSACKRYDIRFQKETGRMTNWTDTHIAWLKKRVKTLERPVCQLDIETLLVQYTRLGESIEKLESEIQRIGESDRYKKASNALCTFRGIDILSSMSLICELGDIRRFGHPRQLTSYAGLDVAEYSSGGKERKKGITKTGNKRIRTILTESCQTAGKAPIISKRIKQSRANQPPEIIDVSDRCMKRLHKKATRMLYAGKHKNKITTACAREMLGFIWEALRIAA
jgi:transposase